MCEKVNGIKNNIGCCGLACSQCNEGISGQCKVCIQENKECSIRKCCQSSNMEGCWSCNTFPCEEGMFNNVRVRAFVKCAKEDGVDKLLEHLVRNKENGIVYHKTDGSKGDYDVCDKEEDILKIIRTGAI
jgi:hypothetical protein